MKRTLITTIVALLALATLAAPANATGGASGCCRQLIEHTTH